MCGSISGNKSWKEVHDLYSLSLVSESLKASDPQPSAVVRPTEKRPFIRVVGGKRGLDVGVWGFPPPQGKRSPIINARSETIDVLPTFRTAFEKHRCAIPATGYFEWKTETDGTKTPWRFSLNGPAENEGAIAHTLASQKLRISGEGGSLFVMAGLFMLNRATGDRHFAVVTTEPNEVAALVHDRMPVILTDGMMDIWLTTHASPAALKRLCRPYSGKNLVAEAAPKALHRKPAYDDRHQIAFDL